MKLSIIIVHYGPTAALQRGLDSLTAPGGPQREIIVVHNGGDPPPEPDPQSQYSIVPNPGNPGFAHACNTGATTANGKMLLFLNPDAVATPGDLETLLAEALAHPEFAVLSCRQTNSQGRPAKTFDSFPSPASVFGLTRALARWFAPNQNPAPRSDWKGIVDCDWVSGSVLMISAADLQAVGGWSEDFWLYMEDVDICKRIRNQGMRVGCTAAVTLTHDHGTSTRSDEDTEVLCRSETTISSHAWAARHLSGLSSTLFHSLQFFRCLALLIPLALVDLLTLSQIRKLRTRQKIFSRLLGFYFSTPWKQKWTSPRAPSQGSKISDPRTP
jgi:GT2 family glycosyltransferase